MVAVRDCGGDLNNTIVNDHSLRAVAYPRWNWKQKVSFNSQLNVIDQFFAPRSNDGLKSTPIKPEFLSKIAQGGGSQLLEARGR